jgi:hypothetical protein
LNSKELHRAFLVDVVNFELKTIYNINWEDGSDFGWAGIADLAGKPDLLEMVKTASSNEKSFEENFGLKVLLKGRNDRIPPATIKDEDLPERFMFVGYQVFRGGGQLFISPTIFKKFLSAILEQTTMPQRRGKFHFLTGFVALETVFFS